MDRKTIDSVFRKITENENKKLKIHFVYAARYFNHIEIDYNQCRHLRLFILEEMKKYKIETVMLTRIHMWRYKLITKEAMEKDCKGENEIKDSVNDDLESFFQDLRLGKQPDEDVHTYFLPKLTKEEMELVERKDISYLKTFSDANPDVPEAEMKHSESDSKFVRGFCYRRTFTIENKSQQNTSHCCNLQ